MREVAEPTICVAGYFVFRNRLYHIDGVGYRDGFVGRIPFEWIMAVKREGRVEVYKEKYEGGWKFLGFAKEVEDYYGVEVPTHYLKALLKRCSKDDLPPWERRWKKRKEFFNSLPKNLQEYITYVAKHPRIPIHRAYKELEKAYRQRNLKPPFSLSTFYKLVKMLRRE